MKTRLVYFFFVAAAVFAVVWLAGCERKEKKAHDTTQRPGSEPALKAPTQSSEASPPIAFDRPPPVGTKARCPVMGGVFTVSPSTLRSSFRGKHYVFCCDGCKPLFDKNPGRYTGKGKG